ncbi:MAG: hypothetical protein PHX83_14625 [Acidobacteriia bacterium]|nr:hypothetical protein [Terriglobia bacterium]
MGTEKRKLGLLGRSKAAVVMGEFYRGTLRSSSGALVKDTQQAKAIAMSEGRALEDRKMRKKTASKSKPHKTAHHHPKKAAAHKKTAKKAHKAHARKPMHRAEGHFETLVRGKDWLSARHSDGRMHVESSDGEVRDMSVQDWEKGEEKAIKEGFRHSRRHMHSSHATHHARHLRPAAFGPSLHAGHHGHSTAPTSEWDRLWKAYHRANQQGSLREQIHAGERLLKFDRVHGTPPLPHVVEQLKEARQLVAKHAEAFKEAKALEAELAAAKRTMQRRGKKTGQAAHPLRLGLGQHKRRARKVRGLF